MNTLEWTGISTPFRIENGSVAKSRSYLNSNNEHSPHIVESIRTIIMTNVGEIITKNHIGNKFRKVIFNLFTDDFDVYIRHNLKQAIETEDYRVTIKDISLERDIEKNILKFNVIWDINEELLNDISNSSDNEHSTVVELNIETL